MKKDCDDNSKGFCPVEASLEMLSGKWKGRILWKLYNTPTMRFGELRRSLGLITEKMLAQQLRELESLGLIKRHIYREVPPKVEYSLTEFGKTLGPILDKFAEWGVAHLKKVRSLAKSA